MAQLRILLETQTSKVLIASHVTQLESKLPIFQYYSYNLESNESTTSGLNTLNTAPLKTPLEKAVAPTAAAVLISFNIGSSATTTSLTNTLGKTRRQRRRATASRAQVTLSFSVPTRKRKSVDTPCQ